MAPSSPGSSAGAAPLPPLPDPQGGQGSSGGPQSSMAGLISGLMPVKSAVDGILQSCKQIVQSGAIPGSEQVCSQIIALATSLLPMAAQSALQPGGPIGPPGQM